MKLSFTSPQSRRRVTVSAEIIHAHGRPVRLLINNKPLTRAEWREMNFGLESATPNKKIKG